MNRSSAIRPVVLLTMAVVTAWSLWAWAQPNLTMKRPAPGEGHMHMHTVHAAHEDPVAAPEEPEDETPGPINWTAFGEKSPPFIATLINFALLAAGYYYLGKKPIALALRNRRDAISKEIDEAQAMKREAEARAKTYQAKLEKLEDDVRSAHESLLRAGEAERERIVNEADAKAERMRKDAEFMVEQELKQMRLDLWRDAVEAAVVAAETMLRERVTPADQERLAEEYLADLGRQNAEASRSAGAS